MALEEKRAWIAAVVSVCGYAVYLVVVLVRADGGPIAETPYAGPLLWTIGLGIGTAIVLNIVVGIAAGMAGDAGKKDQRDREIYRVGEHMGQSFVAIGAVTALVLALLEVGHFWIANALYLAFVLASLLSSVAQIVAYRRGFQSW